MPRIDIGNFGNDVPQAVAAPDRSAIARGVQALGQAGFSVAAELQQRKEATARNTAANDLLDHELKVKTLAEQYADDLATGKRDPTEARAKFDEEAQALESKKIDFLPPEAGDALRRGRERTVFQAGAVVDRAAEGETRRRGQVQVSESIAALEAMAALPGSDVAAINKRIAELEPMATNAGIPIDRFRAASTQAQESNWMNEASLRAGQNRNNPAGLVQLAKDLTEGKYVGKFDAGRRNTILAGVESSLNNIEMRRARAEERAAREQELHLAKAGAAFNAFQALADKGTMLDPAYTDQVLAATAGTPYQASIRAQMAYAKENGGLAAQPVEQQQRVLDAIDRQIATTGRTPALDARREQVAKVLSGSQEDVKRDGLRAAFERGVIADLAPIDVSNAITLAATAGDRADQAAAASQWAGRQVSPLTEDESAKVARRVSSLQPRDRAAYLKAFTEQFGPAAMTAVAAQIASNPNDRSVAIGAYLATRSTTERRSTAEVYFTGQDALAQGTVKPDAAKETGTRAAIYKELAGVYRTQTETNVAADAAYNIWAGLKLEGRDNVKQAVALATGGVIEHQGVPVVKPYGMTDESFQARVANVRPGDIRGAFSVGGVPLSAEDLARKLPGAILQTWGDGTYTVNAGGAVVLDAATGKPFIFDPRAVPAVRPVQNIPETPPVPSPKKAPKKNPTPLVEAGTNIIQDLGEGAANLGGALVDQVSNFAGGQTFGDTTGMVEPGNVDPWKRKVLRNADGSVSTTSSISIGTDKGEVVIPTVINGKRLTSAQAIAHYRKTGEHLGIFDNVQNADRYAQALHNEQARRMGK